MPESASPSNIGYLNDDWTIEIEKLGRTGFARSVRKLILGAQTPFAMSIGGRWGSGKTSMLRVLMAALGGIPVATQSSLFEDTKDEARGRLPEELRVLNAKDELDSGLPEHFRTQLRHTRAVWFNPWHYQQEENPLVPLLHEIREQIREHYRLKSWLARETKDTKAMVEAGLQNLGKLIDHTATLLTPLKKVDLASSIQQDYQANKARQREDSFAAPVDAQRFFLQFQRAINQLVGEQENGRLVVFIDDLDRCSDQAVFRLLEAIKLYLSSRHCVFVFGLDAGHVETAIARSSEFRPREAAQYVEKLFQVRLNLPQPDDEQMRRFLDAQLKILFPAEGNPAREQIRDDCLSYLPRNPRLVKNTLNGLKLHADLLPGKIDWHQLLLVHLFRTFYPDAYEVLREDIDSALTALQNLVRNEMHAERGKAMELYLRRILANPLYHPALQRVEEAATMADFDDDEYREVRANVPQATAFGIFQSGFVKVFASDEAIKEQRIKPYLI